MKCPYCAQEHTDSIKFCPTTGKTIGATLPGADLARYQAIPGFDEYSAMLETTHDGARLANPNPVKTLPDTQPIRIYSSVSDFQSTTKKPLPSSGYPPQHRKHHPFRWIACGCIGLPMVLAILLALVLLSDPFKLNLWGRLGGKFDPAAQVMPANTEFYMGLNIGNMLLTRVDRVVLPFTSTQESRQLPTGANFRPANVNQYEIQRLEMIDNLVQQLEDETGVKVPVDLTPWIGQYAGVGIVDFQPTPAGSVIPSGWIIAIETRNNSRADAFLETLQGNLAERQGFSFSTESYKGAKLTIQSNSTEDENAISFSRAGRMLLIASKPAILMNAIDAPGEQTLEVQANYKKLLKERPRTWSASIYINRDVVGVNADSLWQENLLASIMPLISPMPIRNWTGMLVNATTISNGLRFDIFTAYDPSQQTASEAELTESWNHSNEDVIRIMPQDTLGYLAGPRFDLAWEETLAPIISVGRVGNVFTTSFENSFGFSLQDELLDHLNGSWAWFVAPPNQTNGNLVFSMLAQADNELNLQSLADKINDSSQNQGFTVESQAAGGTTLYKLSNIPNDTPLFTFGASSGYVAISSNSFTLEANFAGEPSLLSSPIYQESTHALPDGVQLSFYLDLEGFLAQLRSVMAPGELGSFNSGMSFLEPIRVIASGNRQSDSDVAQNSIILLLKNK